MVAAAASTVMDKVLGAVLVEEVKEERVEMVRVGLEEINSFLLINSKPNSIFNFNTIS